MNINSNATQLELKSKSSSKNGYEIRADMLQLAKEIVQFEHNSRVHRIEQLSDRNHRTNQLIVGNVKWPDTPTVDEILSTAQKLYEFVNKR
jgi:predicted DNA-binding helix-hairpin-helix protein